MRSDPSNTDRFGISHPIKHDWSVANLHEPQLLCPLPRPCLRISSWSSPPAGSHTGELATATPVSSHDRCRRRRRRSGRVRDAHPRRSTSSCCRICHHRHSSAAPISSHQSREPAGGNHILFLTRSWPWISPCLTPGCKGGRWEGGGGGVDVGPGRWQRRPLQRLHFILLFVQTGAAPSGVLSHTSCL